VRSGGTAVSAGIARKPAAARGGGQGVRGGVNPGGEPGGSTAACAGIQPCQQPSGGSAAAVAGTRTSASHLRRILPRLRQLGSRLHWQPHHKAVRPMLQGERHHFLCKQGHAPIRLHDLRACRSLGLGRPARAGALAWGDRALRCDNAPRRRQRLLGGGERHVSQPRKCTGNGRGLPAAAAQCRLQPGPSPSSACHNRSPGHAWAGLCPLCRGVRHCCWRLLGWRRRQVRLPLMRLPCCWGQGRRCCGRRRGPAPPAAGIDAHAQ